MDLKMEVYTPDLQLIGILEQFRSLIFEEKAFTTGSFSTECLITRETLALLQPENILWIAEESAGIIEYIQEQAGSDGPYISVKGRLLSGILDRRILWGVYDLYDTAPVIMRTLVDECAVHPTRGDVEARKIPGLVLSDAPSGGDKIRIQRTGGTLLESLEEIGAASQTAFGVRFNPAVPQMEFWTRPGKDRSVHQNGNEPVFYSTELDDVLQSEYSYNSAGYRNITLVAGEGEGTDRVYVTVEGASPDTPTPPVTEKYTITLNVDPSGGGIASGGGTFSSGTSVTVSAAPSDGYTFAGWRENGAIVSTDASYTFTVSANRNLTAVFAAVIPTYTITASIDPEGSGTVSGAGTYQQGQTVTVTATPGDGYEFAAWKENGTTVSTNASYTFTATKNTELLAFFKVQSRLPSGYTELTYIQSGNGQYINTGIVPPYVVAAGQKIDTKVVLDVEPLNAASDYEYYFGCRNTYRGGSNNRIYNSYYMIWRGASASYALANAGLGSMNGTTINNKNTTQRIIVTVDGPNAKASIDGVSVTTGSLQAYMPPITLLAVNHDSYGTVSANMPMAARIFSCQIYKAGVLVRDFVPCKDSTGAAGLYDLVNALFYKSASASNFLAGPEI